MYMQTTDFYVTENDQADGPLMVMAVYFCLCPVIKTLQLRMHQGHSTT